MFWGKRSGLTNLNTLNLLELCSFVVQAIISKRLYNSDPSNFWTLNPEPAEGGQAFERLNPEPDYLFCQILQNLRCRINRGIDVLISMCGGKK